MDINVLSRVESFYPLLRGARSDSVLGDATAATQLAASSPLPEQPAAEKETDAGDAAHAEAAAGPAPAPPARSVASGRLASAEAAASRGHKQRLHASVAALLLHNLAKGCALGWSSTTAVLLLYALQRQQARRPLALVASVEHARWAAFFGVLLAAHNGVARALGPGLHYGGAAAGAVGGLALALAPRPARGHVALLCAVRAAEVAARHAAGKGVWPAFVARHGSLVVMCAASAPVLFCWLFSGHSLDPGYLRFLNRQARRLR